MVLAGRVGGRVQGVWFRRHVADAAMREGVTGHARNLADGSVEILLVGDPLAVAKVRLAAEQGPAGAQVAAVHWEEGGDDSPPPLAFRVL